MKILLILLTFFSILVVPVYAQTQKNPSLILETFEIPPADFNKVARDSVLVNLPSPHSISWQVTIKNNLTYANPNGNAVIRFYDLVNPEKFIEIGMGSPPENKFWLAVQIPDDTGYVVIHSKSERGWIKTSNQIMAYTENAGLTVNNGERIVVTNLDIGSFQIDSYSVFGMEGSTDPPAINSGTLIMEFMSGDPTQNQYALFPFYLAGGMGILVAVLLITKKRN